MVSSVDIGLCGDKLLFCHKHVHQHTVSYINRSIHAGEGRGGSPPPAQVTHNPSALHPLELGAGGLVVCRVCARLQQHTLVSRRVSLIERRN